MLKDSNEPRRKSRPIQPDQGLQHLLSWLKDGHEFNPEAADYEIEDRLLVKIRHQT